MPTTINMTLDPKSIDRAIKRMQAYQNRLERKCRNIAEECAKLGALSATIDFSRVPYVGDKDLTVNVRREGEKYVITAAGETVMFLEFGSGAAYGDGHPDAAKYGFGPGTWSDGPNGKHHWNDPRGWYVPKEKGGGHSYGNPPAMAMYNASKNIQQEIEQIARRVFAE